MKDRTPQDNQFNKVINLERIEFTICIISYLFSLFQIVTHYIPEKIFLVFGTNILIILFFVKIYKNKVFDEASNLKRRFFLDNSFGTVREPHSNKFYYDNNSVEKGIKRTFSNLHENVYFTLKITQKMKLKYFILTMMIGIIPFVMILFSGLDNISFFLLNVVLSGVIVKRTYHIYVLNKTSYDVYIKCNDLASNYNDNPDILCFEHIIIDLLIVYENALSTDRITLSDSIYRKLNSELTDEWNKHKKNYLIYE